MTRQPPPIKPLDPLPDEAHPPTCLHCKKTMERISDGVVVLSGAQQFFKDSLDADGKPQREHVLNHSVVQVRRYRCCNTETASKF